MLKPDVLVPGQSLTRQIRGGETHSYRVDLSAGQSSSIRVGQEGIDLTLRLVGADRKVIADVDWEHTGNGTEGISINTETPESFTVEITPTAPKAKEGRYSITATLPAAASDREGELFQASRKYYEAVRLIDAGKIDAAIEAARASVEIRERVLGTENVDLAYSEIALGSADAAANKIAEAESALNRALEIIEKSRGKEGFEYSDGLFVAGRIAFSKGDLKTAEQLLLRVLSIREKIVGPDSLATANTLHLLAIIYRAKDDLPNAERSNLRALKIRETLLGEEHVKTADTLNNLGLMYFGAGDYIDAETMLQRALAVREKAVGPVHRLVGATLNNLGLVEWKKKDYPKAEAYWQRSLKIFEEVSGPDSDDVAGALANLGIIYKQHLHDLPKAEETQKRALAISLKRQGEYSASTANAVSSLGLIYRAMGNYDKAEEYGLRALRINEKTSGPNHHYTVLVLASLARLYAIKGDVGRALEYFKRIESIEGASIPLNLSIGSERQKLAYFSQLQTPDRNVTFLVDIAPDRAEARDLVLNQIIQRKGRILDALSQGYLELGRRASPEERDLLTKMNAANSDISAFTIEGPKKLAPDEYDRQLLDRLSTRDKLEEEINRKSSGYYEPARPATIQSLQPLIPDDAALIEFSVWYPFNWKSIDGGEQYGEPRYIAFVLRKHGEVKWRELGPAKAIDKAIDAARVSFRDPKSTTAFSDARTLYNQVFKPIRELAGDSEHLLISPDGELNLVPFEAMMSEKDRFLIEDCEISYLSSGRELSRMGIVRPSKGPPLVIANPAFGFPLPTKANAGTRYGKDKKLTRRSNNLSPTKSLSEAFFPPLSGSEQEANAIKNIFADSVLLKGENATESALKNSTAPFILHIATHGYFLGNDSTLDPEGTDSASEFDNPLLLSGLALAGANRRDGKSDDGILTALEASGLDLWGTKLVVLSACDTGVGEVRDGEGVYGLRRSFAIAGAESIVMSLWPVSDYITRELMTGFYKNLKNGLGRGESLRQVKLEMLKTANRRHPFYWASFIQSGEWTNLDGKR